MEKKYIVHNNLNPSMTTSFSDWPSAVMDAIKHESATISNATNGELLYVTHQHGDTRLFITTVGGTVRIVETAN